MTETAEKGGKVSFYSVPPLVNLYRIVDLGSRQAAFGAIGKCFPEVQRPFQIENRHAKISERTSRVTEGKRSVVIDALRSYRRCPRTDHGAPQNPGTERREQRSTLRSR